MPVKSSRWVEGRLSSTAGSDVGMSIGARSTAKPFEGIVRDLGRMSALVGVPVTSSIGTAKSSSRIARMLAFAARLGVAKRPLGQPGHE